MAAACSRLKQQNLYTGLSVSSADDGRMESRMSDNTDSGKNKKGRSYPKTVEQIELEKIRAWEDSENERQAGEKQKEEKHDAKHRAYRKASVSRIMKLFLWCMGIMLTVLLAYFCAREFGREVEISDSSMEPAVSSGDIYLINSLVYRVSSPKRGDIIVFRTESDNGSSLHVKRVIGLPGETIQIVNGQVKINGQTHVGDDCPAILNAGLAEDPVTLTDHEYFVLGDNRNGSEDSRSASIGNVTDDEIVGKIWLRIPSSLNIRMQSG